MSQPEEAIEITVVFEDAGNGQLTATIPALPGAISCGKARAEALDNVIDALRAMLSVPPDETSASATTESVPLTIALAADA